MKLITYLRTYLTGFSPRATRLLAAGLVPVFLSLVFLLLSPLDPAARYGALWQARSFAFWVDSVGAALLLLVGGVFLLDYAEKHDPPGRG